MMTAKYARLLSDRFDSIDLKTKTTSRFMWMYIYPGILKEIQRGGHKLVVACELTDPVIEILAKQGYVVIHAKGSRLTEINWEAE